MANVKNNSAAQDTRRRLLQAAGEIFAERGLHGATIKDITDRASASLASVNYHFRDKTELYAALLKEIADDMTSIVPPEGSPNVSAATRLRQFIRHFCTASLCQDRPLWKQILLAREWQEPTSALEPLNQQVIHPLMGRLSNLVAELLNANPAAEAVGLGAASILGQCLHLMKHRQKVVTVHPQLQETFSPERFAEHIADFSLAGIRQMRRPAKLKRQSAAKRQPVR